MDYNHEEQIKAKLIELCQTPLTREDLLKKASESLPDIDQNEISGLIGAMYLINEIVSVSGTELLRAHNASL